MEVRWIYCSAIEPWRGHCAVFTGRQFTPSLSLSTQVRVLRKVDNTIHRINHYPADSVFFFCQHYICWIAIYPVDSVNQPLKNWGQVYKWIMTNLMLG